MPSAQSCVVRFSLLFRRLPGLRHPRGPSHQRRASAIRPLCCCPVVAQRHGRGPDPAAARFTDQRCSTAHTLQPMSQTFRRQTTADYRRPGLLLPTRLRLQGGAGWGGWAQTLRRLPHLSSCHGSNMLDETAVAPLATHPICSSLGYSIPVSGIAAGKGSAAPAFSNPSAPTYGHYPKLTPTFIRTTIRLSGLRHADLRPCVIPCRRAEQPLILDHASSPLQSQLDIFIPMAFQQRHFASARQALPRNGARVH